MDQTPSSTRCFAPSTQDKPKGAGDHHNSRGTGLDASVRGTSCFGRYAGRNGNRGSHRKTDKTTFLQTKGDEGGKNPWQPNGKQHAVQLKGTNKRHAEKATETRLLGRKLYPRHRGSLFSQLIKWWTEGKVKGTWKTGNRGQHLARTRNPL